VILKIAAHPECALQLPIQHLEKMCDAAVEGCRLIYEQLKKKVQTHSYSLLHARGTEPA